MGGALIGVGGRGPGTFNEMRELNPVKLAECDVRWLDRADDKTRYTDFRRVLERKDIDVVAIGRPPHWHALISIMAMQAGKDGLCEKPMTRFIAEGRAVAEAEKRYKRIFQITSCLGESHCQFVDRCRCARRVWRRMCDRVMADRLFP